ncbi:SUMF1/EgtB/PvdO family nonheme iron enzyme [Desulfococcus sp.]|uniref:SUMF1/EgtB/PvdO family nonheme iron enzyme n=1 Tax=Desulfococcus sp. TaxID=2025834 RepID=UPI0035937BDA
MTNVIEKRKAQLGQALDRGLIDPDTFRAALAALECSPPADSVTEDPRKAGFLDDDAGQKALQQPIYLGQAPDDPAEALAIYRRVIAASVQHIPLRGADVGAGDAGALRRIHLSQIYVDLDIHASGQVKPPMRRLSGDPACGAPDELDIFFDAEDHPTSALEATSQERRLVILGDPGSGKSTFLNHLCLCLAAHPNQPNGGWMKRLRCWPVDEEDIVPIPVALRDFSNWLPDAPGPPRVRHLWYFILSRLKGQNLLFAAKVLENALENGRAILLLDGLDETPSKTKRAFVRDAVAVFASRYSKSRIVLTCRILSYQDSQWQIPDFPAVRLAPLDDKKIDLFITAWYDDLVRIGNVCSAAEGARLAGRLQAAVRRPDLRRLAPNPLLLTVMTLVHTHKGELPEARAKLYEEAVDILLWRWEQIKTGEAQEAFDVRALLAEAGRKEMDLKRVLWHLAFEAQLKISGAGESAATDIDEILLQKALAGLHPQKDLRWTEQMLQAIKHRTGLLIERAPEVLAFPHRSFQEYLAGSFLAAQPKFAQMAAKLSENGDIWRLVTLLAVGKLFHVNGHIDTPLALVGELCAVERGRHGPDWRKIWLAGEILQEIGPNSASDSALGKDLSERVRARISRLIQGNHLTTLERVAAGNTLAALGDARFRTNFWGLPRDEGRGIEKIGFLKIEAGPFQMGSDPSRDPDTQDREQPFHSVDLPTFFIARYPVTVNQYRLFIEDAGARPSKTWHLYNTVENHPVVLVTWHDAVAYCRWLTARLRQNFSLIRDKGWRFRLPSEAEWEKAARGADGRIYPWGNRPDPGRANYYDTRIGAPSPVGSFPAGASPCGCLDMAGNVWEWTRSLWGREWEKQEFGYPYDPEDPSREDETADNCVKRLLRGGSYLFNSDIVRCAYRYRVDPSYANFNWGFRVACVQ